MKFYTRDSDHKHRNDQEVTIIKMINEPDLDHDLEVLPMIKVRFADGVDLDVWSDELRDQDGKIMTTDDLAKIREGS